MCQRNRPDVVPIAPLIRHQRFSAPLRNACWYSVTARGDGATARLRLRRATRQDPRESPREKFTRRRRERRCQVSHFPSAQPRRQPPSERHHDDDDDDDDAVPQHPAPARGRTPRHASRLSSVFIARASSSSSSSSIAPYSRASPAALYARPRADLADAFRTLRLVTRLVSQAFGLPTSPALDLSSPPFVDVDGDVEGVARDFFGETTTLPSGAALLARRSRAKESGSLARD